MYALWAWAHRGKYILLLGGGSAAAYGATYKGDT